MAVGKKADIKFIAFLILAIVGGVIFVVFVVLPTTTGISSDAGDSFCHLNAALKSAMFTGGHWVIPLLSCHERTTKVDANNWDECDADGKRGWKSANNRVSCAAYQLAILGKRCFEMYGEDTYKFSASETGTYPCFKAKVVDFTPSGTVIDESKFTEGMRTNGYCTNAGRFNNDNFACGNSENVAGWRDIKSGENKICFDEFGGSDDGIRVNDGC
ncbi:MAG: hypothetical protein HY438_02760 [DPANN group archaeon]|nr:hypothetical protein [DPANN group archaeon]